MLDSRPKQNEEVLAEITLEGYVVVAPTGEMYRFNGVAEYVWARCDGAHAVREIISRIVADFEAPSVDEVERDVLLFVQFLMEKNLVQVAPSGGAEEGFAWPG